MLDVTVDMIESFKDIEGYCSESDPCKHGPFEIVLKDGRTCAAGLRSNDIYSILKGLQDIGVENENWSHFKEYSHLGEYGWTIRPASAILTEIFNRKQPEKA